MESQLSGCKQYNLLYSHASYQFSVCEVICWSTLGVFVHITMIVLGPRIHTYCVWKKDHLSLMLIFLYKCLIRDNILSFFRLVFPIDSAFSNLQTLSWASLITLSFTDAGLLQCEDIKPTFISSQLMTIFVFFLVFVLLASFHYICSVTQSSIEPLSDLPGHQNIPYKHVICMHAHIDRLNTETLRYICPYLSSNITEYWSYRAVMICIHNSWGQKCFLHNSQWERCAFSNWWVGQMVALWLQQ